MRRALRTAVLCLAVLSLLPVPAVRADLQEMMDEQFTALTNYTGPASFQTTRRAALTGGGVYTRVPIMTERLLSLVPPSLDAGCSGIDFFAGSFSFINADQFIALMKATAANAAGYAFQLAMSAMCETCMAAIETLQKKVQELNQYFGNSCQLAQGIVNDTAAAMGFQRGSSASLINTASGVADVFGSWTSADGENPEVKAAGADPDAYAAKVQGNLVWRALQRHGVANWFLGGDNALLEVAMNITGTVIIGELQASPDGGQAPELIRIVPNPDLFRVLVEGGEATIRGCGNGYDADECTELVDKTVAVTGYQPRLRQLLLGDGVEPGLIQRIIANNNGGLSPRPRRACWRCCRARPARCSSAWPRSRRPRPSPSARRRHPSWPSSSRPRPAASCSRPPTSPSAPASTPMPGKSRPWSAMPISASTSASRKNSGRTAACTSCCASTSIC